MARRPAWIHTSVSTARLAGRLLALVALVALVAGIGIGMGFWLAAIVAPAPSTTIEKLADKADRRPS